MDPTEEVRVTDSFCTGTREMRPRIVQNEAADCTKCGRGLYKMRGITFSK